MSEIFQQDAVSFTMLYGGALLGVLYAVLRGLRHVFPARGFTVFCDMVFVGCGGSVTAYCLLITTGGVLRAYALFLLLCGFLASRYAFCGLCAMIFKKRYNS